MTKPDPEAVAGQLLAQGQACRDIAAGLGVGEDELLRWAQGGKLKESYRRCIRLREMQNYGAALKCLWAQMQEENPAIALKAAHEVLSRMAQPEEEGALVRLRETEDGGDE